MEYIIKTVLRPDDLNGLYDTLLSEKKYIRASKNIVRIFGAFVAILFWALAAVFLFSDIYNAVQTHSAKYLFISLPMVIVFLCLGLLVYSKSHSGFKSKIAWKSYQYKNIEIEYRFNPVNFSVIVPSSQTVNEYSLITRICEDSNRFYLFTSKKTAYLLPKRDFPENVVSFRADIVKCTGLDIEYIKT